jgi:hypothetical protein
VDLRKPKDLTGRRRHDENILTTRRRRRRKKDKDSENSAPQCMFSTESLVAESQKRPTDIAKETYRVSRRGLLRPTDIAK